MEATALSIGKSVLDGALGYAKSALAEEVALQFGVQRDHAFIRGELEMMQAFLKVAHDERDNHEVLMTWVKQVRDVAYDAEDCLQEFSIHLHKPSWWHLPSTLRERRRIAKQMKELRARVEDVSQRNLRYQLIKSSGSMLSTSEQPNPTAAAVFGIDNARRAAKQDNSKVDLLQLIRQEGEDLRVIAVWGTSGDLGQASIINEAYENPDIVKQFPCRAWVRISHPFNPNDFIQSLVKQFLSAEGIGNLLVEEMTREELAKEFTGYVNQKSYLVVLNGLSTFEEWIGIRNFFPNNKKWSRIMVCTSQAEVASLCAGQGSHVLELKQLSADQTIYAFYEKDSQDRTNSPMSTLSSSDAATTSNINSEMPTIEILENQPKCAEQRKVDTNILTRIKTMKTAMEESQLIGREKETSDMVKLISDKLGQQFSVISVWGMGGLGKTTLVKDVYQSNNLTGMFEKRAFATVQRPFNLKELLRNLIEQLSAEPSEKKGTSIAFGGGTRSKVAMMGVEALSKELGRLLGNKCLIVLDDLSSTAEWNMIMQCFPKMENTSRIIVTTREENIAKHCCSEKQENIYVLKILEYKDALDLFTKKVFMETTNLEKHPELMLEAKSILKKCNGLPLAIVTIGGFLANQPKTALKWRKLNDHVSAELEINPELKDIRTILSKSYDGLPYHLKSCFLYMSIFPEDHKISRRRLVQRWTAEGYSREIREKPADEIADRYFMELIGRSMILPCQESMYSRNGIDSCQVHDLMRAISITKSTEENLVLRLEEGCSLNTHGTVRHLTISSNWEGDKGEFEATVDLSRIRSLTVFGKWRPFFLSANMCLLRVLDLENIEGLYDHHLNEIEKLLHLKYLSLRGCRGVFHIPDSLGNLKQLQTLDIKDTSILKLPNTIINLRKLQYIYAGGASVGTYEELERDAFEVAPQLRLKKTLLLILYSAVFCVSCCSPQFLDDDEISNRRYVCNLYCYGVFPFVLRELSGHGVALPRGLRKLRALHTLSTVDISVGKRILIKDIKRLTLLRRLGVTGINKKNSQDFCSTLDDLSRLESLSVHSAGEAGLHGCLDGVSSPPKSLQSLKLAGSLVKLSEWIEGLHNLVKLKLKKTKLSDLDTTMQVLGKLPNLVILRLLEESFEGEKLHLTFGGDELLFQTLTVLQLRKIGCLDLVEFKQGATPMLELLMFREGYTTRTALSGLSSLLSFKELVLEGNYQGRSMDDLRDELARNPNKPVLKRG